MGQNCSKIPWKILLQSFLNGKCNLQDLLNLSTNKFISSATLFKLGNFKPYRIPSIRHFYPFTNHLGNFKTSLIIKTIIFKVFTKPFPSATQLFPSHSKKISKIQKKTFQISFFHVQQFFFLMLEKYTKRKFKI